jgi:hypothetical protein
MDWREKIKYLSEDLKSLEQKALDFAGCRLESVESCARQLPLNEHLEHLKRNKRLEHIYTCQIRTFGAPCLILCSKIYTGLGFLIFDGPIIGIEAGEGFMPEVITLESDCHVVFKMVCGSYRPHLTGISKNERFCEKQISELFRFFTKAVRQACKENGITALYLNNHHSIPLKQDEDGLHLLSFRDFRDTVDRWRFAAAFREFRFGKYSFPFGELFESEGYSMGLYS